MVSVSPQVRASVAAKFHLSATEVGSWERGDGVMGRVSV